MIKIQGEDSLITVECLRGRLVAERAASRVAKENAELMETKLKELEKQLKAETVYRRKAEKKLKLLRNKMEALNIPFSVVSSEFERSSSSDDSAMSCISSITSNQVEETMPKSGTSNSSSRTGETIADSEINSEHEFQDITVREQKLGTNPSAVQQQSSDINLDGLGGVVLDKDNKEGNQDKEDDVKNIDNSMALVLVESPIDSNNLDYRATEEVNDDRVTEVLATLKQIKESILITMERRRLVSAA